uniref:Uncharacterized protein LOC113792436 isoform X1 n=1 Tax=Dermatophagoides pteronyssinus TaxID=6956 RepID=A0A6P6Y1E1_DERPT|nr:uncharacterized protein LOC113792436 isoform X1 [Dermatophagoides pteronyssinus]
MIFDLENCNDSSENCLQPEQQQQPEQSNDEQLHCLPGTSSSCTPSCSRTIESRRQSRTNLSTTINNNLQSTTPIISATSQKRFELFDRIKQFYSILLMMAILLTLIRLTTWIGTTTSTDHRHNYYQQYLNSIKFNKNFTATTTTKNQLELSTIKHHQQYQQRNNDDDRNKTEQQQQQQQENDKLEIVLQRQIIQQTKIIDCATFFLYLMSLYGVYNENYTLSSTTTISMIFMLVIKLYLILFDPILIWWKIFHLIIPIIIIIVSLIYLIQLDYLLKFYDTLFPTPTQQFSTTESIYSDQERRLHQLAIANHQKDFHTTTIKLNDFPPSYQEALDCPLPKYSTENNNISIDIDSKNENDDQDEDDENSQSNTNEKIESV